MEEIIMGLIVNSGDARSLAMGAIQEAKKGNFERVDEMMQECNAAFLKAHEVQTKMIQDEINGQGTAASLLMVHAQDHLMNALTVKDLAEEFIYLIKENNKLKEEIK